ncbi:MAG: hypothetical protein SFV81_11215 [Pirellulaceae bacterium]|nr:hypothetical protein [Pirellulaceae bacterium]
MRNFLTTTKSGLSAMAAVGRRTCLAAMLATSLTATSGEFATAQSPHNSAPYSSAPSSMEFGNAVEQGYGLVSGVPTDESEGLVSGSGRVSSKSVPATLASMPSVVSDGGYYEGNLVSDGVVPNCNPCYTPGCDVSWYVGYEALWLRREGDDNFTMSRFNRMQEFDYELGRIGGRITAGRLFDCHNGFEMVYTGPFEWQRSSDVSGVLQSNFVPSGDYTAASINTFNNADRHVQTYQAKFNSYELNRTWWTWDVLQTLFGLRYINYEEDYALSTARGGAGTGLFQSSINNNAIGPQIGAQLIRPASLRVNYGFRGKIGILANFNDSTTFMTNAGNLLLNATDESVDVSGIVEMGAFASYQIVPSVRLTAGYEFNYLPRFATVPGQDVAAVNLTSGTSVRTDSDVFLHGGSAGVQILY